MAAAMVGILAVAAARKLRVDGCGGGGGSSAHEAKKKTARRATGIENFIVKIWLIVSGVRVVAND